MCVSYLLQSVTFAPTAKALLSRTLPLCSLNPGEKLEAVLKNNRPNPLIRSEKRSIGKSIIDGTDVVGGPAFQAEAVAAAREQEGVVDQGAALISTSSRWPQPGRAARRARSCWQHTSAPRLVQDQRRCGARCPRWTPRRGTRSRSYLFSAFWLPTKIKIFYRQKYSQNPRPSFDSCF